ncbi:hypothetical protein HY772_09885 [Candidatus Woesearchaeota archaeon]|nr:hypothetical protein [Candidatus Woesearchaeota archaeon]
MSQFIGAEQQNVYKQKERLLKIKRTAHHTGFITRSPAQKRGRTNQVFAGMFLSKTTGKKLRVIRQVARL